METLKSIWNFILTVGVGLFLGFALSVGAMIVHVFLSNVSSKVDEFTSRDWFNMWLGSTVASLAFVFYLAWR